MQVTLYRDEREKISRQRMGKMIARAERLDENGRGLRPAVDSCC